MMDFLKFMDARLKEPSTWASIAMLLGVLHVNIDPGIYQTATTWGMALAAVLGVVLAEVGAKKTPVQITEDALATLAAAIKATTPTDVAPKQ